MPSTSGIGVSHFWLENALKNRIRGTSPRRFRTAGYQTGITCYVSLSFLRGLTRPCQPQCRIGAPLLEASLLQPTSSSSRWSCCCRCQPPQANGPLDGDTQWQGAQAGGKMRWSGNHWPILRPALRDLPVGRSHRLRAAVSAQAGRASDQHLVAVGAGHLRRVFQSWFRRFEPHTCGRPDCFGDRLSWCWHYFQGRLNVRGLNTAATLWCSAAVGVLCGAGLIFTCRRCNGVHYRGECPVAPARTGSGISGDAPGERFSLLMQSTLSAMAMQRLRCAPFSWRDIGDHLHIHELESQQY
ncbi:magnesium ABC transporter ATPase [Brucella neotomae]|nr:magnesium ABC transporter ATPase [Brucella neotomae]